MVILKNIHSKNLTCLILSFLFFHAHAAFLFTEDTNLEDSCLIVASRNIQPSDLTHFSQNFIPKRFRAVNELYCSGSHQYTPDELKKIITTGIPRNARNSIIFVDLREEPHLMFQSNSTASIQSAKARAYNGLSAADIQETENDFAQAHHTYQTEEACVKKSGAQYYRIPVTDATRPEDSDVDSFITFLRDIQGKNHWLHFHCLAGLGRTTTFMAMYEMIKTATLKGTTFEDIIRRQHQIGGANLAFMWYSSSRVKWLNFLHNFYVYSKHGFHQGMSWSKWVERRHLECFEEHPSEIPWCSLSYFFSYAQSAAMMTSMRLTQLRRRLFG